jgi:hypothetical protein
MIRIMIEQTHHRIVDVKPYLLLKVMKPFDEQDGRNTVKRSSHSHPVEIKYDSKRSGGPFSLMTT